MKYKNAQFGKHYLVKYNFKFGDCLKDLQEKNDLFTSYIKKWPGYMNENSTMQSYMIMDQHHNCVGETFMYPSTANKNEMNINILMDDDKLSEEDSYRTINELISFLGAKLSDKDSFTINVYNDLDLSKYDDKYNKLYQTINHQSFKYDNLINLKGIVELLGRPNYLKYYKQNDWYKGDFTFSKIRNNFKAKITSNGDETIQINHNRLYDNILIHNQKGVLEIVNSNEYQYKVMKFISKKVNNTSLAITLYMTKDNEIEKCYVDYRLHKNSSKPDKGKIKGIYSLRVDSDYNRFDLFYATRNGSIYKYPFAGFSDIAEYDRHLYFAITTGALFIENLDMLISLCQDYFNEFNFNSTIGYQKKKLVQTMFDDYKETVELATKIRDDIPFTHLKNSISEFIDNNQKKDTNQKRLKF